MLNFPHSMKLDLLYITFIIFSYTLWNSQAYGIQLKLDERSIKEAVQYGFDNKDLTHPELL
ncbi:MAG TPA: hypothetical protein ACFYEM_00155, partial [Candidatus Hypogeohydataceae bacterium YC40]